MTRPTRNPLARYALALGFRLTPGRRHWHASHPAGGRTILLFGGRISDRSQRNIRASLRRAARALQLEEVA
jgi:hypothetical protein